MRPAILTVLVGCYSPPTLPVDTSPREGSPWETPVLSDQEVFEVCAPERRVRIAEVYDGDTVQIATRSVLDVLEAAGADTGATLTSLRLLGLNACELDPPECLGTEAATFVRNALVGEDVRLGFDQTCTDAFDRPLVYVWIEPDVAERVLDISILEDVRRLHRIEDPATEPVLFNTYLLAAGWARGFDPDRFDPLRFENELRAAERLAVATTVGIWDRRRCAVVDAETCTPAP